MQNEITFTDCRIWSDGRFEPAKLAVSGARIEALGDFPGLPGMEISCKGLAVLPALIDNHVHFREPGAEAKEDFRSGSAASAHGGVGMVLEVQNSPPLLTSPELVLAKRRIVAEKSRIRVGLYASATPAILPHFREMAELTSGLKLFMAPSHGDEGLDSRESMRPFFQKTAETGWHLIVHAEDGGIIAEALEKYGDKGPAFFSRTRPPAAEIASVETALEMAGEYGTRLHIFHLTTAGAVDRVTDARGRGVDVTCSTCPHYLFFTDADLREKEGLLKVNPSIKGAHDRERLLQGIRDNEIQIVSTDHAPHRPGEKALPFERVPAGISSADLVLPLMCTLVHRGEITFDDVVRLCITNPAAVHGLLQAERLSEGGRADLVFFDPEEEWVVKPEDFLSRANASPYTGMKLTGRVAATLVDGKGVYVDRAGPLAGLP